MMEDTLKGIQVMLQRVCGRLEDLETRMDELPRKLNRAVDAEGMKFAIESLTEAVQRGMAGKEKKSQGTNTEPDTSMSTSESMISNTNNTIVHDTQSQHIQTKKTTQSLEKSMPPEVKIPSTNTRTMWGYWFYGMADEGVPYRFMQQNVSGYEARLFELVKMLMKQLVQAAIKYKLVESASEICNMELKKLEVLFDSMFLRYLGIRDGVATRHGIDGLTMEILLDMRCTSLARRLFVQETQVKEGSSKNKTVVPEAKRQRKNSIEEKTIENEPNQNWFTKTPVPKPPSHSLKTYSQETSAPFVHRLLETTQQPTSITVQAPQQLTSITVPAPQQLTSITVPAPQQPRPQPKKRKPTAKTFPIRSIRELWIYWHHGNPESPELGPFRHLTSRSFAHESGRQFFDVKSIMIKLTDTALEFKLADSEDALANTSHDNLIDIFNQSMVALLGASIDGTLSRPGFTTRKLDQVMNLSYSTFRRLLGQSKNYSSTVLDHPTTTIRNDIEIENDISNQQEEIVSHERHDSTTILAIENSALLSHQSIAEINIPLKKIIPPPNNIPFSDCLSGWNLWYHGELINDKNIFILKEYESSDFLDKSTRRRYTNIRRFVHLIRDEASIVLNKSFTDDMISNMKKNEIEKIFHCGFKSWLNQDNNGILGRKGFQDKKYNEIILLKISSIFKRLTDNLIISNNNLNKTKKIQLNSKSTFIWSDGTRRKTPQGWEFPLINCRQLWLCWFRGDEINGICPFRFLLPFDIGNQPMNCRHLSCASTVIQTLLSIGDTTMDMEKYISNLNEKELLKRFDEIYDILMHHDSYGNLSGENPGQIPLKHINDCVFTTVARAISLQNRTKKRKLSIHEM